MKEQGIDVHDGQIFLQMTFIKIISIVGLNLILNAINNQKMEFKIMNQILEEKSKALEKLAFHDSLTGLPNRYLLNEYIQKAIARGKRTKCKLAIMYIDLDGFKTINDTMGHAMGDMLLKQVTKRLNQSVREEDIVARQGGDEFIILFENVDYTQIVEVAERILYGFSSPFLLGNEFFYTSPSIGISLYPVDGTDAETLVKAADQAMYSAKERGKNTFHFYTADSHKNHYRKMRLEQGLRKAIDCNELILHYQPQVNIRTGEITGVEALIRWNHPELGLISPMEFIPLAEEYGMIIPIGNWVLETACKQSQLWRQEGMPSLRMAVNISVAQFKSPYFTRKVKRILEETGMDPRLLELEITESIMQDIKESTYIINELRALGVNVSIDDFGTGYSSLSVLNHLPVNKIKIDRSFIKDVTSQPHTTSIVQKIIEMGKDLSFLIIAEGVETEQQVSFLQGIHCDEAQGYFFSPPLPAHEMEQMLKKPALLNC
ncbi:putative bifunctional diguanylate cyclase/phosphodiesterase [Bacillus songklensis]|uniref:Bifunctional diguanylate cyclase/phosphodiesterase n=1 Tax=Bacillus songklensis TaxID=1069116 RepID=A0ABV8B2D7_9BACI